LYSSYSNNVMMGTENCPFCKLNSFKLEKQFHEWSDSEDVLALLNIYHLINAIFVGLILIKRYKQKYCTFLQENLL